LLFLDGAQYVREHVIGNIRSRPDDHVGGFKIFQLFFQVADQGKDLLRVPENDLPLFGQFERLLVSFNQRNGKALLQKLTCMLRVGWETFN